MNGVARISFRDGALIMPARNRYDRELVFEQAEFYARRHGEARLELGNRREMVISVISGAGSRAVNGTASGACTQCGQPGGVLTFVVGNRHLCRHCARKTGP